MLFEGKNNDFKDLVHPIKFKNIAMSLSYHHQQLVCYQLSKSESLVKDMQTASVGEVDNTLHFTSYLMDIVYYSCILYYYLIILCYKLLITLYT